MTEPPEQKQLVRDSTWMRLYSVAPKAFVFESKFATDRLEVSADSIKTSWKSFSPQEQFEFALAFAAKPVVTSEDEQIVVFLMETAPPNVCSIISSFLPRHSDWEWAFGVLIDRVEKEQGLRSNYYSALEVLNDPRAIPVLKHLYETYRKSDTLSKTGPISRSGYVELSEYLCCCRALLTLEGSKDFEIAIREMLTHSDERLRQQAERLLLEQKP